MSDSSYFDDLYSHANNYEWKKIKFIVFSNLSSESETFQKRQTLDDFYETRDLDWIYMKNFIEKNYAKELYDQILFFQNRTVHGMFDELEALKRDTQLDHFGCFFFVFLTFMTNGNNKMDKIHFLDGMVTIDEIWKKVSEIPKMYNKPKIFLVQSDDVNLLEKPYSYTKGPKPIRFEIRTIPTDADRLTITSTLPAEGYVDERKPSFLIQAFAEEVAKNKHIPEALDLYSLTTLINNRIPRMIETSTGERIKDAHDMKRKNDIDLLQIPCTTSTLTKLLYL